jgi:hypothetical protein
MSKHSSDTLKQFCFNCKVFQPMTNLHLCLNCVEKSNTNDLIGTIKSICDSMKNVPKEECDILMYEKYEEIGKSIENICSDDQFKMIKSLINKPFATLEAAISHLVSIFTMNSRFYFTPSQANELVKKRWPSDNYKWHNLLVYMCLDINGLNSSDFTCGMCYFGNFGDLFDKPALLTKYLIERGFDIDQKRPTFF